MWFLWVFGDNVEVAWGVCGSRLLYWWARRRGRTVPDDAHLAAPDDWRFGGGGRVLGGYILNFSPRAGRDAWSCSCWFVDVPAWVFLGLWFLGQFFIGSIRASRGWPTSAAFWPAWAWCGSPPSRPRRRPLVVEGEVLPASAAPLRPRWGPPLGANLQSADAVDKKRQPLTDDSSRGKIAALKTARPGQASQSGALLRENWRISSAG